MNRAVAAILRSPAHRLLSRAVCLLEVTGSKSGKSYVFPVQYAQTGESVVIWPGHAESKRWWRNLREASPVTVWLGGAPRQGVGIALTPQSPDYPGARHVYESRWKRASVPVDEPLVRISF